MEYNKLKKINEFEEMMEYDKWIHEIPFIKFDSDWEVQVIPPFGGAVARFMVKKDSACVSVYLDCYNFLGIFGEPYWEVYPHEQDVYRCPMNKTEELLKAIRQSLTEQLSRR